MILAITVGLGLLTGLLLGLTGAGGGIVAGPLLMLALHLPLSAAAPISLLAIALGCGISVLLSLRQKIIQYRVALLLSVMGSLATPAGIHLSRMLPGEPLLLAFSALLVYRAMRLWQPKDIGRDVAVPCGVDDGGRFLWNRPCARAMAGAGLLAGFFGGLLGVGGGFVIVPAMRKHTPLPMHAIIATSLATLTLVSIAGLLQWNAQEAIDWGIAAPFIAGTVAGIGAGRLAAPKIPEQGLRRTFAVLCLLTAAGLTLKSLLALY